MALDLVITEDPTTISKGKLGQIKAMKALKDRSEGGLEKIRY